MTSPVSADISTPLLSLVLILVPDPAPVLVLAVVSTMLAVSSASLVVAVSPLS